MPEPLAASPDLCPRDVYKRQVAALIDQIYVQERNDNTDEQCAEAKAAWDALTDAQKELVEGCLLYTSPQRPRLQAVADLPRHTIDVAVTRTECAVCQQLFQIFRQR